MLLDKKDKNTYYEGCWKDKLFDGEGKLVLKHDCNVFGDWKKGKLNGDGEVRYHNKDTYEGTFKDGLFHGHDHQQE